MMGYPYYLPQIIELESRGGKSKEAIFVIVAHMTQTRDLYGQLFEWLDLCDSKPIQSVTQRCAS
jgi:hypothetical protein